jgi:hypothetical protein
LGQALLLVVVAYAELAWLSRNDPDLLLPVIVHARVDIAVAEKTATVFWL